VKYEFQNLAIHFSNHSSIMNPFVNVALQAVLSGIIKVIGVKGAQAAAANLFGQSVIRGIGVAAGPVGWVMGGVMTAYTLCKLICARHAQSFKKVSCFERSHLFIKRSVVSRCLTSLWKTYMLGKR
jgi:hypothetical protein